MTRLPLSNEYITLSAGAKRSGGISDLTRRTERSTKSAFQRHLTGSWTSSPELTPLAHLPVLTSYATVFLSSSSSATGTRIVKNCEKMDFQSNTTLRLKYALNGREVKQIVMQRLIKVDGKVRTDATYPAGFMDVVGIEKTGENFRLIYDTKGRFTVHRITGEEAEYKLGKVKRVQLGKGGVPFLVTHDART
jgi:hypothetical protein